MRQYRFRDCVMQYRFRTWLAFQVRNTLTELRFPDHIFISSDCYPMNWP